MSNNGRREWPEIDLDQAVILGAQQVNGHVDHKTRTVTHEVQTVPRKGWLWLQKDQKAPSPPANRPEKRDGSGMIAVALGLLTFLAFGLLSVSVAAQYRLVMSQRHQITASEIEALSLDVGMMILSLLGLALARIGRRSTPERWGIVATAVASAAMNFAAANSSSWRSVLVWTLPSLFLAYIVDRTISVIRRHFLGLEDERSPFALVSRVLVTAFKALLIALKWIAIAICLVPLYVLRLILDPPGTVGGLRRAVMIAAKVPDKPAKVVVVKASRTPKPLKKGQVPPKTPRPELPAGQWAPRPGTKTDQMIKLAAGEKDLATIPASEIAELATRRGKEVGLDGGAARAALGRWVQQLQGDQPKALTAGGNSSAEQDGAAE